MLLSMTGFGEAHAQHDDLHVSVAVRAVNSRHFKLTYRSTDGYAGLEPDVESLVRNAVRRGTVQVNLRVDRDAKPDDYRINTAVLEAYFSQLEEFSKGAGQSVQVEQLLILPGVLEEASRADDDPHTDWPTIEPVVREAISQLSRMRAKEGEALADDMLGHCELIETHLEKIAARAPLVADDFRQRLADRVNKALEEFEVTVEAADLIREVSLFVDRSDISEEVVRLRSHLEQFRTAVALPESAGRKLEFIAQEMGREINTIGSKANDTAISEHVVEIKSALERIREQVQNVE